MMKHRRPGYVFSSWSTLQRKQKNGELTINFNRIDMHSRWLPFEDLPSDHSFHQVETAQMAKEVS
jgi:hypothetical protein